MPFPTAQVKSIYSPKTHQKDDVQVSDSERHRSHQSQLHFEHKIVRDSRQIQDVFGRKIKSKKYYCSKDLNVDTVTFKQNYCCKIYIPASYQEIAY